MRRSPGLPVRQQSFLGNNQCPPAPAGCQAPGGQCPRRSVRYIADILESISTTSVVFLESMVLAYVLHLDFGIRLVPIYYFRDKSSSPSLVTGLRTSCACRHTPCPASPCAGTRTSWYQCLVRYSCDRSAVVDRAMSATKRGRRPHTYDQAVAFLSG